MSTREKLIKARLGMLALAEELQNISLACRRAGISRSRVECLSGAEAPPAHWQHLAAPHPEDFQDPSVYEFGTPINAKELFKWRIPP
jgi:hypothetical protein